MGNGYQLTLLLRSQERIVNGLEFQSLFPIQKGLSLFNRDVLHDAMFDAVIFSNKYRDNVWVDVMTLWPLVPVQHCTDCPLHLTQDWCSSTGHKGIPRSHKYFRAFFGHLQSSLRTTYWWFSRWRHQSAKSKKRGFTNSYLHLVED